MIKIELKFRHVKNFEPILLLILFPCPFAQPRKVLLCHGKKHGYLPRNCLLMFPTLESRFMAFALKMANIVIYVY